MLSFQEPKRAQQTRLEAIQTNPLHPGQRRKPKERGLRRCLAKGRTSNPLIFFIQNPLQLKIQNHNPLHPSKNQDQKLVCKKHRAFCAPAMQVGFYFNKKTWLIVFRKKLRPSVSDLDERPTAGRSSRISSLESPNSFRPRSVFLWKRWVKT